jgi:NTP pyrophosphatase (non-canonical NTP hydrolase)
MIPTSTSPPGGQTSAPEDFNGFPGANSFVAILQPDGASELIRYDAFVALLFKQLHDQKLDLLHGAVSISSESEELLDAVIDAVKKHWIYNKPLDVTNVIEELGDLRFYIQAVMNVLGISEQQVVQENANKLCVRYKQLRYSDEAARSREDKA